MDWYLDPADEQAPPRLRRMLEDFLIRHSTPDSDVDAAVLSGWELITNAVRHAPGPMWVSLDWDEEQPLLVVHDLGPGFDLEEGLRKEPGPQGGFGLKLVREHAEELRAQAKRAGGAKVSARLPVYRKADAERRYVPKDTPRGVPLAEMAAADGTIGRDPFLLGLGVNLAHQVAFHEGPDVAARLINEVGSQVGAEIEQAYREANGLQGPLTPADIAQLFVALKAAIDGDFHVIEANDERIVMGNRACPFGTQVQRAPSLCQMTSAVFGGIAARNTGGSRVVLEERIALGDPGCVIVVHLGPSEEEG